MFRGQRNGKPVAVQGAQLATLATRNAAPTIPPNEGSRRLYKGLGGGSTNAGSKPDPIASGLLQARNDVVGQSH